jgi:hypothetical protein
MTRLTEPGSFLAAYQNDGLSMGLEVGTTQAVLRVA